MVFHLLVKLLPKTGYGIKPFPIIVEEEAYHIRTASAYRFNKNDRTDSKEKKAISYPFRRAASFPLRKSSRKSEIGK